MKEPIFHLLTNKQEGDRVKMLRHLTDESSGYYYGTVFHMPLSDALMVQWDEDIPYCSRITDTIPAILI